jgi:hypothetical protein
MRAGSFFGLVVLVLGLTLAAQPAYAEANAQAKKGEIVILMRLNT